MAEPEPNLSLKDLEDRLRILRTDWDHLHRQWIAHEIDQQYFHQMNNFYRVQVNQTLRTIRERIAAMRPDTPDNKERPRFV